MHRVQIKPYQMMRHARNQSQAETPSDKSVMQSLLEDLQNLIPDRNETTTQKAFEAKGP